MSNIDIKEIEENLHNRLYYKDEDEEDEETYESDREKIINIYEAAKLDDWEKNYLQQQSMRSELNDLMNKKLMAIRKKLNDDKGFEKIKEKLPDIENMITQKKNELDLLKVPKSPHVFQKTYTRLTGNKNTADIAKENFGKEKESLDSELNTLKTIKTNIEKLIPIYIFQEDTRDIELQNRDVMVSPDNMIIGKKYKLEDGNMVTLKHKRDIKDKNGNRAVELTFSNGIKSSVLLKYNFKEVAQEGGKRKTRRQRKSRKVRRRQTNRRR
jgi:hypothetical protein